MKKIVICIVLCLFGCSLKDSSFLNKEGMTVETRIMTPMGYERKEKEGFASYLRNYKLKADEEPLLLYNRSKKINQNNHIAIMTLPLENENLQQCADSIIRIYSEYYYSLKQYEKISFHFVNGFEAQYTKWVEGYRIRFVDDKAMWYKQCHYDDSYETFQKYLRIVFSYASTLSLFEESYVIDEKELDIGDIFIKAGNPGHVVMIVDICENKEGKKAFLLAQGFMPAQEFHIIKNPLHDDPWYYEEELSYPFKTIDYTFEKGSLRRLYLNQ